MQEIPRLTSRSARLWGGATVVAVVVVLVGLVVLQPAYAVPALVVGVLLAAAVVFLVSGRQTFDPASGEVVSQRLWLRRSVGLDRLRTVALVDNRAGGLNLTLTPDSGRALLVPVLLLSDYVQRSQEPGLLRLLADQLEQRSSASGKVPGRLRRQAEHLEHGGTAADSPLAGLVTTGIATAAKGGGAAGGTSLLD